MRPTTVPVVLAALLALTGCSGDDGAPGAGATPPARHLETAKATLDAATGVAFTLTATGLPGQAVGVSGATGDGRSKPTPAFKGSIKATVGGTTGTVEVIAVDQDAYMKLFTPGYSKIDPATLGAPNPARLFDPSGGISSLLTATASPAAKGKVRAGSEILQTYTGTLPGTAIADLFVVGDRTGTFQATYALTDRDELRTATLTGPFYAGSTSTYTLLLKNYGQAVDITRP